MDPMKIDVSVIARDLKLAPENVQSALALLDDGNTIPFVTRFRKDLTGGLNEEQLLAVKTRAAQLRALGERKTTILRTIESQGELTDELKKQIETAHSSRRLEEIYAPFKTKKQSRASLARQQGLVPLAEDILNPESGIDFATKATDFVRVDKGLNTVDDVIKGVSDLVVEKFTENEKLRTAIRSLIRETGKLSSTQILSAESPGAAEEPSDTNNASSPSATTETSNETSPQSPSTSDAAADTEKVPSNNETDAETPPTADNQDVTSVNAAVEPSAEPSTDVSVDASGADAASDTTTELSQVAEADKAANEKPAAAENGESTSEAQPAETPDTVAQDPAQKSVSLPKENPTTTKQEPRSKKKNKKKKEQDPFKDYHDFSQTIGKIAHYRVLAINRGERAGKLRVKIKFDSDKVTQLANEILVDESHPSATFLKKCATETLNRSLLPSIEREIRRELTEAAEKHAVEVFASNLRNLLLQPPIRNKVVLAIDPGYKRGCSVAIIDSCGNLLESGQVFVVGNKQRREDSKTRLRDWIKNQKVEIVAIGNGSGCRQVELLVSDIIAEDFKESDVRYIIINEAGTSTYSTSEVGREELPELSPAVRSAVSIGRRLIDPLSEFVKIAPANIGIGLYQHDIKAKHLGESLDAVVQSCVNRVGVDVNTASAALLRHISGLNALTAKRVIEYRKEHGRFNTREELKNVNGIGETTFVQAAGFLRVHGGENALDATGIHPECYPIANDILKRISANVEEIFPRWLMQPSKKELVAQELEKQALASATQSVEPSAAPEVAGSSEPAATANDTADSQKSESAMPPQVADSEGSTESTPSVEPSVDEAAASVPLEESAATDSITASSQNETAVDDSAVNDSSPQPSQPTETLPVNPSTEPASSTDADAAKQEQCAEASATGEAADGKDRQSSRREFEMKRKALVKELNSLDVDEVAAAHSSGKLLVNDVIMSLKRPAWDPRDKIRKPLFRRGVIKLDDLAPEMQLDGQVINVVDFGVFVDIGLGESSLVHVSQLSTYFINDPFKHFFVGDVIKVWVTEVDASSRRIKLTAIKPGSKKPNRKPRRDRKDATGKRDFKSEGRRGHEQGRAGGRRKPGKYDSNRKSGRRQTPRRDNRPKFKKEVPPITEKMLRGDEPMKTFGDLAQFVRQKPESQKNDKKGDSAGSSEGS